MGKTIQMVRADDAANHILEGNACWCHPLSLEPFLDALVHFEAGDPRMDMTPTQRAEFVQYIQNRVFPPTPQEKC